MSALIQTQRGRALYMLLLEDRLSGGKLHAPRATMAVTRQFARDVVARGIARGELRPDTDPVLIGGALSAAVIQEAIFKDRVPEAYVRRLVDLVLGGARLPPRRRASR